MLYVTVFELVEAANVGPILAFAKVNEDPLLLVIELAPAMAAVPVEFKVPLFVKAAFTVNVPDTFTVVPAFIAVIPPIVSFPNDNGLPPNALLAPFSDVVPVEEERLKDVPLLVMFPPKLIVATTTVALNVPPPFTVTSPVNVLKPVALAIVNVPVTDVEPVTINEVVNEFNVNVPAVTVRVPDTPVAPDVFAKVAPVLKLSLNSRLP